MSGIWLFTFCLLSSSRINSLLLLRCPEKKNNGPMQFLRKTMKTKIYLVSTNLLALELASIQV